MPRYAAVELGGTSVRVAIAEDTPQNILKVWPGLSAHTWPMRDIRTRAVRTHRLTYAFEIRVL